MIDSGFLVALISFNTFSALVFVNCASTNSTSWVPSTMMELVQNLSSEEVTTLMENAGWLFAIDACVKANTTQLYTNRNLNELERLKIIPSSGQSLSLGPLIGEHHGGPE